MKKLLFLYLGIALLSGSVFANTLTIKGYYKSFFTVIDMAEFTIDPHQVNTPLMGTVNNRLRLTFNYKPSSTMSLNVAYDFSPRIQDPLLFKEDIFFAQINPAIYRVDDFRPLLFPGKGENIGSYGIYHNLDRLFVSYKTGFADFFFGRQTIAWGSARVVNTTDILSPFTFNELDTEERRGVDALRVRIPIGNMDELDLGYVFGRDLKFKHSAFFIRGKVYVKKTDLSFLLLGFQENLLIGLDISRSLGGAGFWCEGAYVLTDFFKRENASGLPKEENYFRASMGLDYNFNKKLYGFFEYHFNSAGKRKSELYPEFLGSSAFNKGSVYLMGKQYLNLGVTYQITPLIPFEGLLIFNLIDGSLILSPTLEYNIAENMYLSAGAYVGVGKQPVLAGCSCSGFHFNFSSEFGSYPSIFFTSFRIYF
jgi:hypothetical protein